MTPGPSIIIECPHCSVLLSRSSLGSGNTFGATHWSDGKMDAPMLPDFPEIVRCSKCDAFIWVKDAKEIGVYDWFNEGENDEIPEGWKKAKSVIWPETSDFENAIDQKQGTSKEREKYLRMQLWWHLNDPVRNGERSTILPPENAELFFANLKHLSQLLIDGSPDDQIMRAEIARECGEFEKCLVRLMVIPEKYASICEQIKKLAQDSNRVVHKLQMMSLLSQRSSW